MIKQPSKELYNQKNGFIGCPTVFIMIQFQHKMVDNMEHSDGDQPSNISLTPLKPKRRPRSDIQKSREPHFSVSKASQAIQNNIKNTQLFYKKEAERQEEKLRKNQDLFAFVNKNLEMDEQNIQKEMTLFSKAIETLLKSKGQQIQLEAKIIALKQGHQTNQTFTEISKLENQMRCLREKIQGEIACKNNLKKRRDERIQRSESSTRQLTQLREQRQIIWKRLINLTKSPLFR